MIMTTVNPTTPAVSQECLSNQSEEPPADRKIYQVRYLLSPAFQGSLTPYTDKSLSFCSGEFVKKYVFHTGPNLYLNMLLATQMFH